MKLFLAILLFAAPLFAQSSPCDNPQSVHVAPISVSTTGTVTLLAPQGKSIIHTCYIELVSTTGAAFTITFQATLGGNSTALSGPIYANVYGSPVHYSTAIAGPGATFDLLVGAGSAPMGGSLTYYQTAN